MTVILSKGSNTLYPPHPNTYEDINTPLQPFIIPTIDEKGNKIASTYKSKEHEISAILTFNKKDQLLKN